MVPYTKMIEERYYVNSKVCDKSVLTGVCILFSPETA